MGGMSGGLSGSAILCCHNIVEAVEGKVQWVSVCVCADDRPHKAEAVQ